MLKEMATVAVGAMLMMTAGCAIDDESNRSEDTPSDDTETPYYGCLESSTYTDYIYMSTTTWRQREAWGSKGGRRVRARGRGTNHPYSVVAETLTYNGALYASGYAFATDCKNNYPVSTFFTQYYSASGTYTPSITDWDGNCQLGATRMKVAAANCGTGGDLNP